MQLQVSRNPSNTPLRPSSSAQGRSHSTAVLPSTSSSSFHAASDNKTSGNNGKVVDSQPPPSLSKLSRTTSLPPTKKETSRFQSSTPPPPKPATMNGAQTSPHASSAPRDSRPSTLTSVKPLTTLPGGLAAKSSNGSAAPKNGTTSSHLPTGLPRPTLNWPQKTGALPGPMSPSCSTPSLGTPSAITRSTRMTFGSSPALSPVLPPTSNQLPSYKNLASASTTTTTTTTTAAAAVAPSSAPTRMGAVPSNGAAAPPPVRPSTAAVSSTIKAPPSLSAAVAEFNRRIMEADEEERERNSQRASRTASRLPQASPDHPPSSAPRNSTNSLSSGAVARPPPAPPTAAASAAAPPKVANANFTNNLVRTVRPNTSAATTSSPRVPPLSAAPPKAPPAAQTDAWKAPAPGATPGKSITTPRIRPPSKLTTSGREDYTNGKPVPSTSKPPSTPANTVASTHSNSSAGSTMVTPKTSNSVSSPSQLKVASRLPLGPSSPKTNSPPQTNGGAAVTSTAPLSTRDTVRQNLVQSPRSSLPRAMQPPSPAVSPPAASTAKKAPMASSAKTLPVSPPTPPAAHPTKVLSGSLQSPISSSLPSSKAISPVYSAVEVQECKAPSKKNGMSPPTTNSINSSATENGSDRITPKSAAPLPLSNTSTKARSAPAENGSVKTTPKAAALQASSANSSKPQNGVRRQSTNMDELDDAVEDSNATPPPSQGPVSSYRGATPLTASPPQGFLNLSRPSSAAGATPPLASLPAFSSSASGVESERGGRESTGPASITTTRPQIQSQTGSCKNTPLVPSRPDVSPVQNNIGTVSRGSRRRCQESPSKPSPTPASINSTTAAIPAPHEDEVAALNAYLKEEELNLSMSTFHCVGTTLARSFHLRVLNLRSSTISSEGLRGLADVPTLQSVCVSHMKNLTSLVPLISPTRPDRQCNIQEIDAQCTLLTNEGILGLEKLPRLRRLDLGMTKVTSVAGLAGSRSLMDLSLSATRVDSAGITGIERIPTLVMLNIARTKVTSLRQLVASLSLETLVLYSCQVSDDDIVGMGSMPRLATLDVSTTKITNLSVLRCSRSLKSIRAQWLALKNCQDIIQERRAQMDRVPPPDNSMQWKDTEAGYAGLADIPTLETLDLSFNTIRSVHSLCRSKSLKHLYLRRTRVENAGIANIAQLAKTLQSLVVTNLTDSLDDEDENDETHSSSTVNNGLLNAIGDIYTLKHLVSLDLSYTDVYDLRALQDMTALKELFIVETLVTADGLRGLERISSLETLDISQTSVITLQFLSSGASNLKKILIKSNRNVRGLRLGGIEQLPSLESLDISDTVVEDVPVLWRPSWKLKELIWRWKERRDNKGPAPPLECWVTSSRLVGINQMPCLATLDITNSSAMDLSFLDKSPSLRAVVLKSCRLLRNHSIAHLGTLPALETLDISDNRHISDVQPLRACRHLRELYLGNTRLTAAGLTGVSDLPDLKVLDIANTKAEEDGLKEGDMSFVMGERSRVMEDSNLRDASMLLENTVTPVQYRVPRRRRVSFVAADGPEPSATNRAQGEE